MAEEDSDRVAADAEERRVAEAGETAIAEDQVEADRGQGVDQHAGGERDPGRIAGERGEAGQRQQQGQKRQTQPAHGAGCLIHGRAEVPWA